MSSSITPTSGDDFTVNGELELHGVKKPVTINASVTGHGKDPWGNDRVAYEGRTKISRKDFGLVWNQALETGGALIGDEVRIELTVEAIAQS